MKNLITATACTMLLLAFLTEFVHSQMHFQQMMEIEYHLKILEQDFDEEQQFSNKEVTTLKKEISCILGCSEDEVQVEGIANGKQYQVSFPITKVYAMGKFWGLNPHENRKVCVIRRTL